MPRDSSGNYTLPGAYNPVLTGTTITSSWANNTLNDIAAALTDSLSRSGKGGMNAVLLMQDGTSGAPGLAFASEQTTGLYRNGASQPTFVVNGVPVWSSNASKQFLLSALDNQAMEIYNDAAAVQGTWNEWQSIAVAKGRVGIGPGLVSGATLNDFGVVGVGGKLYLVSNSGTIMPVPTSAAGTTLTVNGFNSNGTSAFTVQAPAAATVGSYGQWSISGGANIAFFGHGTAVGTTPASTIHDFVISAADAAGLGYLILAGGSAGGSRIWIPAGVNNITEAYVVEPISAGAAPIATTHQIGYLESPNNTQNANYTFVQSDRGKTIVRSGGAGPFTWTIPPQSSVAWPNGVIIQLVGVAAVTGATTLAPGAAVTLTWINPGGAQGSGNRTLSTNGFIVNLWRDVADSWFVWGNGIS